MIPPNAKGAATEAIARNTVLQAHMVRLWNDDRVPEGLFAGRYTLTPDSPLAERWAVYIPGPRPR